MHKKNFIHSLELYKYRNFLDLKLDFNKQSIVLHGRNGGGKSNILESISLLAPGRGFRKSTLEDIVKMEENSFQSNIKLNCNLGKAEISNIFVNKSRKILYNGNKITNSELTKIVNIIWLIPQMHNIFLAPNSDRRKFLDRIIGNFDPKHVLELILHEKLNSKRLSFFRSNSLTGNSHVLDSIEAEISIYSYNIFKRRIKIMSFLQNVLDSNDFFPRAKLFVIYKNDLFKEELSKQEFIEKFQLELKKNRNNDKLCNKIFCNVHRADFFMIHAVKKIPAKFCSTGEQKILLTSIIIAQVNAMILCKNIYPILILDEVFVHLDLQHREFLMKFILSTKIQTFITTNDLFYLKKIINDVQLIEIG
ncbi:MAG: AAA family ATPase [Rickettsia sp.]|nr:AAA family ATPase [Rickettsia sp.]